MLRGAWCRTCADQRRAIQLRLPDGLDKLRRAASSRGGACLSNAYLGQAQTYRFCCALRHEWDTVGSLILLGSWCPACVEIQKSERMMRPDGLARLQALALAKGGACLSTAYQGNAHPYRFRCGCGNEWEAIAESVCQGTWCPACANAKKAPEHRGRVRGRTRSWRTQCLSSAYINNATKMSWLCDRGHVWQTTLAVIRTGKWCPTCANMARITNPNSKARMRYQDAARPDL